jgi:hypothetical protein
MSDAPSSPSRDKVPSRIRGLFSRSWSGKDIALIVLGLSFVAMSGYAFRAPILAAVDRFKAGAKGGETVSVFDVVVDRTNRQYFDILFDRPLGQEHVDEVLDPPPATLKPDLGGTWKWQTPNALRFQPSGGLPIATELTVKLKTDKLLKEGQVFSGDDEITVKTDQFLVNGVDVEEEPALEGKAKVIYSGTIHFNYAVKPETLIPKIRLEDPAEAKPIEVKLETDYNNQDIAFRTAPVQKQRDERTVKLVIAKELTPADGNVPLQDDWVHEIQVGSSTKLSVRGIEATPGDKESSLVVTFSSPISAGIAEKYLTIDPAVHYRLSSATNQLTITGDMKPGSTYKVTIGKGMPASDEAVLPEDYEEDVEIPDLEPSVAFQSEGIFLAASGNHTVALDSVNVPKVRMTIDRVYLNNLFFLFNYADFFSEEYGYFDEVSHALGDRLKETTISVGGSRNQRRVTPITLDRYVNTKEPGLYRVSVGKPDDYEAAQHWLLLTDLGTVVKKSKGELMVWVVSIKDLSPVEGARVTLLSDQNQTMGTGTTDGSGVWRLQDSPALEKRTPYMLTIEKGDDFTFVRFDAMAADTTGLDVGGAEPPGDGYQAFLYGERDLYRPGETLRGLAIVRDGALQAPPAMPALLRHRDPQGRELETRRIQIDARGLANLQLDLPGYSLTGHHTLELEVAQKVIGTWRFQVEEFVPDRISVEIQPPKTKVGPGQDLAYGVQGDYLFGAPAANLPVETRVRLVDSTFSAPGFEGFSFRDDDRKLEDREVFNQQGTLDAQGHGDFKVTMPEGAPVPSSLEAVVTAHVQEQGGRGVAAMQRMRIDPYPYYVGLRRMGEEGFADPGKPAQFEYAAVSPDGKPVASGNLRADVFEDRWNTVLRRVPGGGFRYESTRDAVLVQTVAIPAGQARGTFEVTPKRYGDYRVVLTDPNSQAAAQAEFYAAGWGTSPWAIKNPSRLELDLDKTEYAPGDTAVVQVRAPFSGKLLVTVERDKVLDTQVYTMTGNTAKIELPIREEYRPNAYVTATLVRPVGDLEPGSAGRAFGSVPLPVDRIANHLTPQITAPQEMRPGTRLDVVVKTRPGAVVTVAAVDEGILQLIAQKTPEPFDYFYRKLALGVNSYDTFSLLLPEVKTRKAPAGGGEGAEGMAQYVRTEGIRRVQPVAFWSGPLVADGDGNVKVSFPVPEFQGALRIMAVAHEGVKFGGSELKTRVRDPIVLLPTVPRVLSFGETLQVPVTVRNDTGKAGPIQVGLAVQGPVKVEGPATVTADIPPGREKTVSFTVSTGNASGAARFVITAAGNGEKSHSSTDVPVRPDLPEITLQEGGGVAQASLDLPLANTGKFRPETLRRELRIGPLPLVQFGGRLEDLLRYPYGCLEQTTSISFPLVYLGDLAKALQPDLLDPKKGHGDPADMVQAGVRKIATMQLPSGGFSLWPGEREVYPWGSVYATHFLVEAKKAGHPVDDNLYNGALRWVAGQVRAKQTYGSEDLQRTVYGLYVLARAGKPDLGTMDFLRTRQDKALHAETRALLAAAYAAAGNPKAVQELLARVEDVEKVERQTGGNLNSAIRNRALLLLAMLDAAPGSPRIPALADRLARDSRELSWWTTQEESFTLLALGQLAHRQAQFPPYSGTVFVGGRKLGTFTNATATFSKIPGTEPVRIQMDPGYKAGAAFFSLASRGVPTDEAYQPATDGMEIQREVRDRDGNVVDLNSVKQGDLLVIKTQVRSTRGAIANVAVVQLLPSGLEVENPRLETTEKLPWITDNNFPLAYLDLRDDRILVFASLLPPDQWQTYYTLVRAVAPGKFRLPPVEAEAMYDPTLRAAGVRGMVEVKGRTP